MNEYEREMVELYKKSIGEKKDFYGIVCPGTYKQPCRLCDLCKEVLFDKQTYPKEHPLRKKASNLNAKQHYFSNVLFSSDPTEIVVFEYGDKIFKQLLAMQMNELQGFKDFFHPISGRWIIVERIQTGASRDQVEYYCKPKDPSKLPNMEVLGELTDPKYNLTNVVENIKAKVIKPIYQSKLDKVTLVRVLPSWLGPDYAFKFFQKIDYHYNISEEDFDACQAGEINPVRLAEESRSDVKPASAATSSWTSPRMDAKAATPKKENPYEKMWGGGIASEATVEKTKADKKLEEEQMGMSEDDDDVPPCYGDFDETDPDCTDDCPVWKKGCISYKQQKLEKRKAAKRLSK